MGTGLGAAGAGLEAAADGRTGGGGSALDAEPAVELSTCARVHRKPTRAQFYVAASAPPPYLLHPSASNNHKIGLNIF